MTDNTYNIIHSHADELLHSAIDICIFNITVSSFKVIIQSKAASGNTSISTALHRSNKAGEECLHFPPIPNTGGCRNNQFTFWEKYSCLKGFKYDRSLFM